MSILSKDFHTGIIEWSYVGEYYNFSGRNLDFPVSFLETAQRRLSLRGSLYHFVFYPFGNYPGASYYQEVYSRFLVLGGIFGRIFGSSNWSTKVQAEDI